MTQTILGHRYEDFKQISQANTTSNNGSVNMISPYSSVSAFDADSTELQNWYNVNVEATQRYFTQNSSGNKLGVSRDYKWNLNGMPEESRTPLSRHYWCGSFNTQNNSTCFTHVDYGNNVKSDGFLHVLDPYSYSLDNMFRGGREIAQGAMAINIQFNNLPAFTWVPLAGMTFRFASYLESQTAYTNSAATYTKTYNNGQTVYWNRDARVEYTSGTYNSSAGGKFYEYCGSGWQLPAGIDQGDSTITHYGLDNKARYQFHGWHSVYIIYCHDGNGKGMLATCAGMMPTSGYNSTHQYSSYKIVHGQHMCYNNQSANTTDSSGTINWAAPHKLTEWFENDTGATNTRLERLWDQFNNNSYGLNVWGDQPAGYYSASREYYHRAMIADADNPDTSDKFRKKWSRNAPKSLGMLIAYGDMGDNADLSSPTTFYLNRHSVGGVINSNSYSHFHGHGFTNQTATDLSYQALRNRRSAYFITGALGNLFFQNVPVWARIYGASFSSSQYDWFKQDLLPGWIIHPTIIGDAQVNNFALTTYQPKYRNTDSAFAASSSNRKYNGYVTCVPRPDEAFQFPVLSSYTSTYDPVRSANNINRMEYTTGSWRNVLNITDGDANTSTACLSTGVDNALYIKFEPSTDSTTQSDDIIDKIDVKLYGLTVPVIGDKTLYVRVTDDNKNDVLSGSNIRFSDYSTGTSNKIPGGGVFHMSIDNNSNVTYGDLSAGYLKMYVE